MKCKLGSIITDASGSLGGHTFQNSKGGFQIRTKPIPHGKPSAEQLIIRSYNPVLQAGWRALTTAQQKIWNDYPETHGIFNAKGDKHPLSGHSLWMKYQYGRLVVNRPFLTNPSFYLSNYFGPNLVLNSTFDTDLHWTIVASWEISGGRARFLATGSDNLYTPLTFVPGKSYRIEIDIYDIPVWNQFYLCGYPFVNTFPAPWNNFNFIYNGHLLTDVLCVDGSNNFSIYANAGYYGLSIDNVTVKEIFQ